MNIQPTQPSLPVSIPINKIESVVEASVEKMVRVEDTSGVEPSVKRIVSPPEINGANIALQFAVDTQTGQRIVQVIDKETGELIRQVPPEELLNVMHTLRGLRGVLLSTKS
ncbi:MAG: flagellar protein FlaG [Candidatus Binatia bacterium]